MPNDRLILFVGGELDGQLHRRELSPDDTPGCALHEIGQYVETDHVVDRSEGRAAVYEHRTSDRGYSR